MLMEDKMLEKNQDEKAQVVKKGAQRRFKVRKAEEETNSVRRY
jgi:hypothetical protein